MHTFQGCAEVFNEEHLLATLDDVTHRLCLKGENRREWAGHGGALLLYGTYLAHEARNRGIRSKKTYDSLNKKLTRLRLTLPPTKRMILPPPFMSNHEVLESHREGLAWLDPDWYQERFPDLPELFRKPDVVYG